jgi:hypothetical protein
MVFFNIRYSFLLLQKKKKLAEIGLSLTINLNPKIIIGMEIQREGSINIYGDVCYRFIAEHLLGAGLDQLKSLLKIEK